MHRLVTAAGLVLGLLGVPGKTVGQACPSEVPATRRLVERFLTRPSFESDRQATGLTGVPASSIRPLVNGSDDSLCQQLNATVGSSTGRAGPWRWSYYTAGGRFFVALQYDNEPGTNRVGFVPIYIYDSAFRMLGTYAM